MDINAVIQEAILKGLMSIVTFAGKTIYKKSKKKIKQDELLSSLVADSLASANGEITIDKNIEAEQVQVFLSSPEVEAIIRQIISAKLTSSLDLHEKDIRKEFYKTISLRLGIQEKYIEYLSSSLFNSILMGSENTLQALSEKNLISDFEEKDNQRFRMLLDEIGAIQKNLEFLTRLHIPNTKIF